MFTHSIHSNSFCSIIWFLLFLVLTTHSVDFLTFWWVVTPSVKTTGYIGLAPPQGKISHPISVGHSGRKTCLKLQCSGSVWISDCKHIACSATPKLLSPHFGFVWCLVTGWGCSFSTKQILLLGFRKRREGARMGKRPGCNEHSHLSPPRSEQPGRAGSWMPVP